MAPSLVRSVAGLQYAGKLGAHRKGCSSLERTNVGVETADHRQLQLVLEVGIMLEPEDDASLDLITGYVL